jgi:hypothetical protein
MFYSLYQYHLFSEDNFSEISILYGAFGVELWLVIWWVWSEIVVSNISEELYCVTVVEWKDFLRKSLKAVGAVDVWAAAGKQIPIPRLSWWLPSHHIDWAAVDDRCAVKQAFV